LPFFDWQRPRVFEVSADGLENRLREIMGFKQMTKVEDRRLVGDRVTAKLQSSERAHRLDVIERLFGARIRELVPLLEKVDPQHDVERIRPSSLAGLGIVRLDQTNQRRPRHDGVHLAQESFALGLLLLVAVIKRRKAQLRHLSPPLE
jgi:hypothetical protein